MIRLVDNCAVPYCYLIEVDHIFSVSRLRRGYSDGWIMLPMFLVGFNDVAVDRYVDFHILTSVARWAASHSALPVPLNIA